MNRYWGRNNENTNNVNFYRTDNQISALNVENLFDPDYITKLFTPSDSNIYYKHSNNYYLEQEQRILQSNAQQQKGSTWYPTSDLPEEILLFGTYTHGAGTGSNYSNSSGDGRGDVNMNRSGGRNGSDSDADALRLGYELILKHNVVYNLTPALKYPDISTLMVYRQASLFNCIVGNIRDRINNIDVDTNTNIHKKNKLKLNDQKGGESGSGKTKGSVGSGLGLGLGLGASPSNSDISKSALLCSLKIISNHIKNKYACDMDWTTGRGGSGGGVGNGYNSYNANLRMLVIKQISNMNTFIRMLWTIHRSDCESSTPNTTNKVNNPSSSHLDGDLKSHMQCILQHGYVQLMLTYYHLSNTVLISTHNNDYDHVNETKEGIRTVHIPIPVPVSYTASCKVREQSLLSVYGDLKSLLQVLSRCIHTMFCIFVVGRGATDNSHGSKVGSYGSNTGSSMELNREVVPMMLVQLMVFIGRSNELKSHWSECVDGISSELNGVRKQLLMLQRVTSNSNGNSTAVPLPGTGKLAGTGVKPVGNVPLPLPVTLPLNGNLNSIVPIKPSSGSGKHKPGSVPVPPPSRLEVDGVLSDEPERDLCTVPSPTGLSGLTGGSMNPITTPAGVIIPSSVGGIGIGIGGGTMSGGGGGTSPTQFNNDELLAFQMQLQVNASAAVVAVATNSTGLIVPNPSGIGDDKTELGPGQGQGGTQKKLPISKTNGNKAPVVPALVVGKPKSNVNVNPMLPDKQPFNTEVTVNYSSTLTAPEPYLLLNTSNKTVSGKKNSNNLNTNINIKNQIQEPNCDTELELFGNVDNSEDPLGLPPNGDVDLNLDPPVSLGSTTGSLDPSTDLDSQYNEIEIENIINRPNRPRSPGPVMLQLHIISLSYRFNSTIW